MNDWELLGIVGGGIVLGLVLQNNKSILANIIPPHLAPTRTPTSMQELTPSTKPEITPVSTEASRPSVPPFDPRYMRCPPGKYLDQTFGIYSCVGAHGTKQLAPANKTNPLLVGYGDDGYAFVYDYDYASPPLIPAASQPLAPPTPESQILTGPVNQTLI
jgi:hypothetical protein